MVDTIWKIQRTVSQLNIQIILFTNYIASNYCLVLWQCAHFRPEIFPESSTIESYLAMAESCLNSWPMNKVSRYPRDYFSRPIQRNNMDYSVKKIFMPDVASVKFSIWRILFGTTRFARISPFFQTARNRYNFPDKIAKFESAPRNASILGRIVDIFPDKVGLVPNAIVKKVTAILEQPVAKHCLLLEADIEIWILI